MGKYVELCSAYASSRARGRAYRDRCREFSYWLYRELIAYMEAPDGRIQLVSPDGSVDDEKMYGMADAGKLKDDSYFHIGLQIRVTDSPQAMMPRLDTRFVLRIKEQADGSYIVKYGRTDIPEFVVAKDKVEDLKPLFDDLHHELLAAYEGERERKLWAADN